MTVNAALPRRTEAPALPPLPALVAAGAGLIWVDADGIVARLEPAEAAARLQTQRPLLLHARALARRLGLRHVIGFDVLELYAFVHPGRFVVATATGLSQALGLSTPASLEAQALSLHRSAQALLRTLAARDPSQERSNPAGIAAAMDAGGEAWPWAPAVLAALGESPVLAADRRRRAVAVWRRLPEWSEQAPPPPAGSAPVSAAQARERLAQLVTGGALKAKAEPRQAQADYAAGVARAFDPRAAPGEPWMVLAEAGTGVGKTLGYLAPATVWAEQNDAAVWISTYTRNLQHQIDDELDRLYPDPTVKARKVVLRKGRENYLCLLNMEEAAAGLLGSPTVPVGIGLVARWAAATRDGDLSGGDFPGWLADLVGRRQLASLADRRGECIYAACAHYHRCFVERSARRARRADIVVANHALVMVQAALGRIDELAPPTRFVFDEGHHLFDAADSAFAAHLTGLESAELRRWLIGAETATASRARGLKRRLAELVAEDEIAQDLLAAIERAARALPGEGWQRRLSDQAPKGAAEAFLMLVRAQVYARAAESDAPFSLEVEPKPLADGVAEAAKALAVALASLLAPMQALVKRLDAKLEDDSEELSPDTRRRIDALARGLERRAAAAVSPWRQMAANLAAETPEGFVDWFGVERIDGRDVDLGYYRHWVDPMLPFLSAMSGQAHGMIVTSATLTDAGESGGPDWPAADERTGARHAPPHTVQRLAVPSPFDYPKQTRVLVVGDVRGDGVGDGPGQLAGAYRALFEASGGGALGLFTSIGRLKSVQARIAGPLAEAGLPLYAQHVDGLDVGTLVEIFRAEENACLLGTDAVRDGVDVPGRALRLIVFDRVPWPRPDIRHKARRKLFGETKYDDRVTRLRLRQAFGRLVRRGDDTGVFVLLDGRLPTRLASAFPPGVAVERVGIAEAVRIVGGFVGPA